MKNLKLFVVLIIISSVLFGKEIVNHNKDTVYYLKVGDYLTIELPKDDEYKIKSSNKDWETELLLNYIWLKPLKPGKLKLNISNRKGEEITITAEAKDEVLKKKYEKIIVKNFYKIQEPLTISDKKKIVEDIKKDLDKNGIISKKPKELKEKKPKKSGSKFNSNSYFNLAGGIEKLDKTYINMEGEFVIAARSYAGLFLQGAGILSINDIIKKYGLSVGAGFENEILGFFLFSDVLLYKFNEYNSTFHFQLRPAIRWKSKRVLATLFYAVSLFGDSSTGAEIEKDGEILEVYNKALSHIGFDVRTSFFNKVLLDVRGLIASDDVYKFDFEASYNIFSKLFLFFEYSHSNYGNYPILIGEGFTNCSRISAGISYNLGKTAYMNDLRKSIIFKPDYPLVVSYGKTPENEKGKNSVLKITLSAIPQKGPAPLYVDFSTILETPEDSEGPYKMNWYFKGTGSKSIAGESEANYIYPEPGVYNAYVEVTDESTNLKATSNIVKIEVTSGTDKYYKIKATAGSGGTIKPSGTVSVQEGSNYVFDFVPGEGYRVKGVKVDKTKKGILSSFKFKNIQKDHEIHVDFEKDDGTAQYKIESISGDGGYNDPEGTIIVNEGDSKTIKIIPGSNYRIKDVKVDGRSVGAKTEVSFSSINKDHKVESFFEISTYTITAITNPGGTVSPLGVSTVSAGDDKTYTITADTGQSISDVLVDGVSVGAVTEYTFQNVQANHTIEALFGQITYTIVASSGSNGSISPDGNVSVVYDNDQNFDFIPDTGYKVSNVVVDGTTVPVATSYTFQNVQADHIIHVDFEKITFNILASSGPGGSISNPGNNTVPYDDNMTFTFTPNSGYQIESVLVDDGNVGAVPSYTFSNVQASHTIVANFSVIYYTITPISGAGGSITPGISQTVQSGGSLEFTITSDAGYQIKYIEIDGSDRPEITNLNEMTYTFNNVTSNHTIRAEFEVPPPIYYTITPIGRAGGRLTPNMPQTVLAGSSITFTMAPDTGYKVKYIDIDGNYWPPITNPYGMTYTFSNVQADHTISVFWMERVEYEVSLNISYRYNGPPVVESFFYYNIDVYEGNSHTFGPFPLIKVHDGKTYQRQYFKVDGVNQPNSKTSHTFSNVQENHSAEVYYLNDE